VSEDRVVRSRAGRATVAVAIAAVGLVGCAIWAALVAHAEKFGGLSIVLAVAAVAAGLGVAQVRPHAVSISAAFLVVLLSAAFIGPAAAFVAAVLSELAATRVQPPRAKAFLFNLVAAAAPALIAGTIIRGVTPHHGAGFYALLGVIGLAMLELTWVILAPLYTALDGPSEAWRPRTLIEHLPGALINVALAVAGAAIYVQIGLAGIAFALAAVFAFTYMAHLLEQSRGRAAQYVSLSWGVLGGLMRALDVRDERAARHAAAVARFARDMAAEVGMDKRAQELAHTAGLLHDIGHFALSDRVHERGRTLTDEDWVAIQRHPELGADILQDLGMYGPVAEIVLAHHERIDGRGYPNMLEAEEIPEIAKIISVAEVYDTLTAKDTYRTRMSSFEALRELRRVAGSQLDARYVEVLAGLLSGEGLEYRHADEADFDTELDMERRIREARTGTG
jgi:putative nucleotidyltransferase with HDIG domain